MGECRHIRTRIYGSNNLLPQPTAQCLDCGQEIWLIDSLNNLFEDLEDIRRNLPKMREVPT